LGIGSTNNPALWARHDVPKRSARPAIIPGESKFPFRSDTATGAESGGLDGCATRAVWLYGALPSTTFAGSASRAESMGFGRIFRVKERFSLQIRAEFQNIFNRLFYSLPLTRDQMD